MNANDPAPLSQILSNFQKSIQAAIETAPDEAPVTRRISVALPKLPERHKGFAVADNTDPSWADLYSRASARLFEGIMLGLVGVRGSGKTQLAVCLVRDCCRRGRSAHYSKAFDIFLRIRQSMRPDGDSEARAVSELVKPYLLVIDAFEVRGDTPFENRVMDHIIDKRYDAVKSTIIISNDTAAGLKQALGESVVDRMRQCGGIVEMGKKSFREKNPVSA
jgi:DNA replication protein DnaC